MSSEHCHFSCKETDLGLRSRIVSLKINKLPTFLKLFKGAMFIDYVYMVK